MPTQHLGDTRYSAYVGSNREHYMGHRGGFEQAAEYLGGPSANPAASGPRYPVYSHMENAAAWQPTAHGSFGGDMSFAYGGYREVAERGVSAYAAGDGFASCHTPAAYANRPMAGREWMGDQSSRGYFPGARGQDMSYFGDARGPPNMHLPMQRRYTAGHMPVGVRGAQAFQQAAEAARWGHHARAATTAMPGARSSDGPLLL